MKLEEFDFNLPEELIAQTPLEKRDESRLLVLDKKTKDIKHRKFKNIIEYLNPGDILVLNDTKVLPARLIGEKEETSAVIEVLLLKELTNNKWETLVRPAKRVKIGTTISFGGGLLKAKCIDVLDEGIRHFELIYNGILVEILDELGSMPLPPYIHEKLENKDRYNTVYAKNPGSAAAPTAGLHWTPELLEEVKKKNVSVLYITLHVGLGTFRPVQTDDILNHHMHEEYYEMNSEVARELNAAKKRGSKIIAVGTTSVRTLETIYNKYGEFRECSGSTDIFIYPGYEFKAVDHLITNFHLPKSTLLMLISALAGKDLILTAYQEAIKEKYRFFSFGDSMFII